MAGPPPGTLQDHLISSFHPPVHACMSACVCVCVCVCAQSVQSCLTLCNAMDYSLPGSSVQGILQTRILPSSRGSSLCKDGTSVSCGSSIAGGFFTTEPLGKPRLFSCTYLFSLSNFTQVLGFNCYLHTDNSTTFLHSRFFSSSRCTKPIA